MSIYKYKGYLANQAEVMNELTKVIDLHQLELLSDEDTESFLRRYLSEYREYIFEGNSLRATIKLRMGKKRTDLLSRFV